MPAPLAGINLQFGLTNHRGEQVKTFETEDGRAKLRAVTGPDYGRIHDHELVEAVQRIAGNGTGDTRWKVCAQAGHASEWGEPDLAERLRHRADLLDARLVDPLWRAFAAHALQIVA